ncbi:MAG: outer membrane beta-barrel protein [Paenibacillus sp.]|nr:outer membrane beta-barrel protein [Paenibacillus sp.]
MISALITLLAISIPQSPDSISGSPNNANIDSVMTEHLDEIVVKARRPQAIVTPEKVSFNPSATLSGSDGTLYDALSSLPGISVNGNSISVNGQNGITITIDGRKLMLQGNALESYLKSLPVSNINRIELVSAPAAKNDASSSPVILNITLRHIREHGFTAGVNGNIRGWRAGRGLGSMFIDAGNGKSSLTASYSFIASRNPSVLLTDRPYITGDDRITQVYDRHRSDRNHNAAISLDHNFSSRWSAGLSLSGNWFSRRELGIMDTSIPSIDSNNLTTNLTRFHSSNIMGSIYATDKFNDRRGELSIGFDYFHFTNDEDQGLNDTSGSDIKGDMGGTITGYVGTADFTRKLNGALSLSAGVKSTLLLIDNGGRYDESDTGTSPSDDNLSSRFSSRENVNAAYLEGKFSRSPLLAVTLGGRVEQTNVHNRFSGNESSEQSDYSRHTIGAFFNASVSSRLTDRDGAMLSYARRVNRPKYSDLNPFVYIFDDITHVGGNINLREAISSTLQLTYSRDAWLRCTLSGSYIKNDIVRCYREISDRIVYTSPENLPRHLNAMFSISAMNIPITGYWDISATFTMAYHHYRFDPQLGIGTNCRFSPMIDCRNRIDLPSGWSAEVSGQWHGRMAYGQARVSGAGSIYLGLRKSILGGRINATAFVRDLLNTNRQHSEIWLNGRRAMLDEREYEQMRQIGVSISLRIHSGKLKTPKKREKDVIDEIKRVNLQ